MKGGRLSLKDLSQRQGRPVVVTKSLRRRLAGKMIAVTIQPEQSHRKQFFLNFGDLTATWPFFFLSQKGRTDVAVLCDGDGASDTSYIHTITAMGVRKGRHVPLQLGYTFTQLLHSSFYCYEREGGHTFLYGRGLRSRAKLFTCLQSASHNRPETQTVGCDYLEGSLAECRARTFEASCGI